MEMDFPDGETARRCCEVSFARFLSQFVVEEDRHSGAVIVGFPAGWSLGDWVPAKKFGEVKVDLMVFPSMKTVGSEDVGKVNGVFEEKFRHLLQNSDFQSEVQKVTQRKKSIIFTGHSVGGAVAALATIWHLEHFPQYPVRCVTFGSPLIGDKVFGHAIRREGWSSYFTNFVLARDIVPRLHLSLLSEEDLIASLQKALHFWESKGDPHAFAPEHANKLFMKVMRNAFSVSSYESPVLANCANGSALMEAAKGVMEISPYRPFGVYVFVCESGRTVKVENYDAILQILFYSMQVADITADVNKVALSSMADHVAYEKKVGGMGKSVTVGLGLPELESLPLSAQGATTNMEISWALNDLGLSTQARLSLRAAAEKEKQRSQNLDKIRGYYDTTMATLHKIEEYRKKCRLRGLGYYDSFKVQKEADDFKANVDRLEVAGLWDDIVEMVKAFALPDTFEIDPTWVYLATRQRLLVEPLDVANFYRHDKGQESGPYMKEGRPKRYRYPEKWLEHLKKTSDKAKTWDMEGGLSPDSCFWAPMEEICLSLKRGRSFQEMQEDVNSLERNLAGWLKPEMDALVGESSLKLWWNMLPQSHRAASPLAGCMN